MASQDSTALSPQAWCRRILTALVRRKLEGRDAGDLEMLLTFFIQKNPDPQTFTEMLARYAHDPRPSFAEAASLLQRAWLRGRTGATAPPIPPLGETLRTVGALLDEARTPAAYLITSPHLVQLQIFGAPQNLVLGTHELRQEIAARTALRGQVAPSDSLSIERYETRLRIVGTLLDEEPTQSFALVVTRRSIVAEGSAGYYTIFTNEDLASIARSIVSRRQSTEPQA